MTDAIGAFTVNRVWDNDRQWWIARNDAKDITIRAKDRAHAYEMVNNLNAELEDREFQIKQDSMVVAGASGPGAAIHAMHYAAVYSQDGPVTVQEKINGRWRNFAKIEARIRSGAYPFQRLYKNQPRPL